MANLDLTKYGITGTVEIVHNPSYDVLFAEETKAGLEGFEKGQVTELGAVNVMTGIYTGRSPKDKFLVKDATSENTVWWTSDEYKNDKIDNFDNVFDKFIQNTFVSKSNLQLDTYESQTKGEFFDNITKNISMITAQAIYNQLVEDVRKKSKEKVYPPISFRKLIDKKGIDISSIKNQIDSKIIKQNDIGGFYFFLIEK